MSASLESLNVGKFHVGPIPSPAISGLSLSAFLPGLMTAPGPAYFGAAPGVGIDLGTVNIGPKLGLPPAPCSLNVVGPIAANFTGMTNVIGAFNVYGVGTKLGADISAAIKATVGATAEVGSTANASNNATAGNITCATITAGFGAFASVAAPFKQFDIPHPTRSGYRLAHAALEGPEMGVYYRGKTKEKTIPLPEYWTGLVHEESITVQLTPIGKACSTLHVKKVQDNVVYVGHQASELEYYYIIHGERKDLDDLVVEYKGEEMEDFTKSEDKIVRSGEKFLDKRRIYENPDVIKLKSHE